MLSSREKLCTMWCAKMPLGKLAEVALFFGLCSLALLAITVVVIMSFEF
jgi:hypothetical protein